MEKVLFNFPISVLVGDKDFEFISRFLTTQLVNWTGCFSLKSCFLFRFTEANEMHHCSLMRDGHQRIFPFWETGCNRAMHFYLFPKFRRAVD